jgi:hypothetical protein
MPCYDSVPPSALRPLISPLPGRVALIGAWLCIIIVHVSQACCSLRSDSRRSRCSALGSSLPASSGSTFELGTETQGYPTAYTAHEAASLYRNIRCCPLFEPQTEYPRAARRHSRRARRRQRWTAHWSKAQSSRLLACRATRYSTGRLCGCCGSCRTAAGRRRGTPTPRKRLRYGLRI